MRTLLRNFSNGLYFEGPDQWTSDPAAAHNFKLIDRAVSFAQKWGLQDVEIAFAFVEVGEVTTMPLHKTALRYSEP